MTSFFHLFLARILLVYQSCHRTYQLKVSYSNLSQIQNLSSNKALLIHPPLHMIKFSFRNFASCKQTLHSYSQDAKVVTKILSCVPQLGSAQNLHSSGLLEPENSSSNPSNNTLTLTLFDQNLFHEGHFKWIGHVTSTVTCMNSSEVSA